MRKIYLLIILALVLISFNIQAQSPLDQKKKNKVPEYEILPQGNKVNGASGGQQNHRYKHASGSIPEKFRTKIKRGPEGLPLSIQGNPKKRKANLSGKESTLQSCYDYLNDISGSTKIKDASDFSIINIADDELGHTHVRLQQKFLGVPIHGAEVIVHFKDGEAYLFNGRYQTNTGLTDVAPVYSSAYAINKTITDLSGITSYMQFDASQQALLNYVAPGSELIVYKASGSNAFALAWHVSIRPNVLELWDYFINAKTGEIIHKSNQTCSVDGPKTATSQQDLNSVNQTLNTYLVGSTYYMIDASKPMYSVANSSLPSDPVGAIWTLNAQNTDLTSVVQITSTNNTWTKLETSAHYNAGLCYDYYKNTHSRNSLDGNGGTIISVINVTSGGQAMDNAYWNGKFMAYGNGNVAFKPLAGGLDVAAHEMTHGVISSTANLEYQGQSGAINESMADIMGCMVDRNDWKIGEDVVKTAYFPSGALRDVSDPHNGTSSGNYGWQPRTMSEYVNTSQDNGGVHTNSGIPNYAFYLYASSTGMDKNKAELVYYKALTNYLVRSSQFIDLRLAVISAATELYGASSTEVNAAKAAFDSVEIFDGTAGDYQNDIPANTSSGEGYMLFTNTDGSDSNSLYQLDLSTAAFSPLTTEIFTGRPSVTDDGSLAYFVNDAGSIKEVTLPPASLNVNTKVNSAFWSSVAVSKDGSKLAATSSYQDSAIYVLDIASSVWTKFHLYNPTFSGGIETDGPVYADAIEWDYTGEYIIYDCFNAVPAGSDSISFWDIGILKAWDNNTNSPGDGAIEKLFANLPEGYSVGNPTFSKNSPYIIAFDFIDENDGLYSVYTYNIQTGDLEDVYDQYYTLGYPSYSVDDSQLAFTTTYSYEYAVATIPLDSDKITPTNTPSILFVYGAMPVWFGKGDRIGPEINVKKGTTNIPMGGSYNWGNSNVGAAAAATTFTIINNGTEDLNLTGNPKILIGGINPEDFSIIQTGVVSPVSSPSGTTSFTVTFNPTAAGARSATITIANDDANEGSYRINLTGTGVLPTGLPSASKYTLTDLSVSPNPSSGIYTVSSFAGIDELIVTDCIGKNIITKTGKGLSDLQIDLTNQPDGLYFLVITSGDKRAVEKLLKK